VQVQSTSESLLAKQKHCLSSISSLGEIRQGSCSSTASSNTTTSFYSVQPDEQHFDYTDSSIKAEGETSTSAEVVNDDCTTRRKR